MNDGFYKTMQETAKQLDVWKDKHLSVPFAEAPRVPVSAPPSLRHVASFPRAPQEYRGLMPRRAGRGVRP